MAALPHELQRHLSAETQRAVSDLLGAPPASPSEQRRRIRAHLEETLRAAGSNEFIDTSLAEQIAAQFETLLEAWDTYSPEQRSILDAAIAYYALSDDAEDDHDSVLGFEDDAEVLNACVEYLERRELRVDIG